MNSKSTTTAILVAGVAGALIGATLPALAAAGPMNVRGTLVSASPTSITVRTAMGMRKLAVTKMTKITGVLPSTRSAITPGTFIGTANVPSGTSSRALEVVVFPAAMKGAGLGNYPWDLPASAHTSSMTNGTVMGSGSSMTNGTVMGAKSSMTNGTVMGAKSSMTNGTVASGSGPMVSVNYGKGSKMIAIPANVPVVRLVAGSPSLLKPGARVFIRPAPTMSSSAALIAVGENGTVPPM